MSRQAHSDEQLLFALSAELPGLRQSVKLAQLITEFPDKRSSKNAVINFAFERVAPAVIENLVLRMSEAVDPYIERAFGKAFSESLFEGAGRKRRPTSDVLALLLRLRAELVAHRIKLGGQQGQAWADLKTYGGIWSFLVTVLDEIDELLNELKAAEYFSHENLKAVTTRVYKEFSAEDIKRLVDVANKIDS